MSDGKMTKWLLAVNFGRLAEDSAKHVNEGNRRFSECVLRIRYNISKRPMKSDKKRESASLRVIWGLHGGIR